MERTALYRHYALGGKLLYVGISKNPFKRLHEHEGAAAWAFDIARVELQWFDTRGEALIEETAAIKTENPIHNVARVEPQQPPSEGEADPDLIFYTTREVASMLQVSMTQVNKAISNKELRAADFGNRQGMRVSRRAFLEFVQQKEEESATNGGTE